MLDEPFDAETAAKYNTRYGDYDRILTYMYYDNRDFGGNLNAASIAGLMLTTEAMVSEIKEKEPKAPAMPGGGMGGMY